MTSFTRRDSEDYQTWLCICFNILSNKGLKLAKFHELSDTNTVTVHTSEYFTADWKIEIKVEIAAVDSYR